jgi:hypothetical protein
MAGTRHKVQSAFPARSPSAIQRLLSGGSAGLAVGAALAAGWELLSGWMMPRGPLTTGEALATMAVSLVIGIAARASMRSGWAMLVAPVVSVVVFEAARLGAEGPTVDAVPGAHEARGRAEPFREWAAVLEAPGKEIVEFEYSGHRPLSEEPAKFVAYMRDTVLAGTAS